MTSTAGEQVSIPDAYPSAWAVDALLIDGTGVRVRPVLPSDTDLLGEFYRGLSAESLHLRFFGTAGQLTERELERAVSVDYVNSMALIALRRGRLIGVARYERIGASEEAEVAFLVADDFQGKGVGTLMLESLAAYANERAISRFVADTLPQNSGMLGVFEDAGMSEVSREVEGVVRVRLDLAPTPEYFARRERREGVATAASVTAFLQPRTIAVVGAGRRPGGVGHEIVRALLAGDFAGIVYPVNPEATSVCGVRSYPTVGAVPDSLDVAVIAVPPPSVLDVAKEAAAAAVRSLVIITAGFAETGAEGTAMEGELLAIARAAGMRIVGPNCLGVCSTDPEIRANATFSPQAPLPGRVGLYTQSGAVGVVLLDEARRAGLGVSNFVSVGNKLDVSGNDLMCYWEHDPRTDVIALYLESFGNPRKFLRIARRVGRAKPIVALKAGRTDAGAHGARSHTASAATPAAASDALLEAAGVVAVDRLDEMLDVVAVLSGCPLPRGDRIALVGNSGGPLILAADACSAAGLGVPELSPATQEVLRSQLVPAAAVANPVNTTADGGAEALAASLAAVLDDDGIDAAIAVITPLLSISREEAIEAIDAVASNRDKPIVACIFGDPSPEEIERIHAARFAVVSAPERAAVVLERAASYGEWLERSESPPAHPSGINLASARTFVRSFLDDHRGGDWIDASVAEDLLSAFGIPLIGSIAVGSAKEAVEAARTFGFPVALKSSSGALVHKTEAGGVALALTTVAEVAAAYETMARRLGALFSGAVVQEMATPGVEVIVGLSVDAAFGPLLMVGLGGVATDLLGDRAFAVPPLAVGDAARLVESIHGAPLFHGYRGSQPVDVEALTAVIERLSRIAEEIPEVAELELNPVIVSPLGAVCVDWKVRLQPRPLGPDPYMRMLRRHAVIRPT